MRFEKRMMWMLAAMLVTLQGCDWTPGSTLSWSQSTRTWEEISDGECLLLGAYTFAVDMTLPPFEGKQSIQLRPPNKEDQEFLPEFFQINYILNDSLLLTQSYFLKKGKGSINEPLSGLEFEDEDELEWEICAEGGEIPFGTEITAKLNWKFQKQQL